MRFIIETINSQRHARRFIVEYIFVNAYRQYGNCRRTARQSQNLQFAGHRPSALAVESEAEIEAAVEVDGADVPLSTKAKSPYNPDKKIENITKRRK